MAYVKVALDAGVYTKHSANVLACDVSERCGEQDCPGGIIDLTRRFKPHNSQGRPRLSGVDEAKNFEAKRTQYLSLDKGYRPLARLMQRYDAFARGCGGFG